MTTPVTRILFLEDSPPEIRRIKEMLAASRTTRFEVDHTDRLQIAVQKLSHRPIRRGAHRSCASTTARASAPSRQVRMAAPDLPIVIQSGLDEETLSVEALRLSRAGLPVQGRSG